MFFKEKKVKFDSLRMCENGKNETNFFNKNDRSNFYPCSTKQVFRFAHVISAQTFLKKVFTFSKPCKFSPLQGLHTENNVMIWAV